MTDTNDTTPEETPASSSSTTTGDAADNGPALTDWARTVAHLVRRAFAEEMQNTGDPRAAASRVSERVANAVTDEQRDVAIAALEAVARELGWDGTTAAPRVGGRGFRPGFGPFGRGFGPGFGHRGFGPGFGHRGFGPEGHRFAPDFAPREDGGHGHGHKGHRKAHAREVERAYERGFEAGFRTGTRA